MTLKDIRDLYVAILPKATFHYFATKKPDQYIVWAEDGQGRTSSSDNKVQARALQGTTDYYTKTEYDPIAKQIEQAMNNAGMTWRLNSIQYEEDTKYIHHEWVWEVDEWLG